jgi:hypothetical protein
MRLVFLCFVAWLVLAMAALASSAVGDGDRGQQSPSQVLAN